MPAIPRLHDGTTKVVNIRGMDTFDLRYHQVVRIDRRTRFGNPYIIGRDGDRDEVIRKYRRWFLTMVQRDEQFREQVQRLRGHVLGCWCAPEPCHGDVILKWLEGNP